MARRCEARYRIEEGQSRRCSRPVYSNSDRCVFHLPPTQRRKEGVTQATLREAFQADIESGDESRREYVDVHLNALDLSSLVVDGDDVGAITFQNVTLQGRLDLSGTVLRHPIVFQDCQIEQVDATRVSAERDVWIEHSQLGSTSGPPTPLRCRRATFQRGLHLDDIDCLGSVEFAGSAIEGWLDIDRVTVEGRTDFPDATLARAQFAATTFAGDVEFEGVRADHLTIEGVHAETELDLSGATLETLRVHPDKEDYLECCLAAATVKEGELYQPEDGVALYDLTDATIGDVALECAADTFDRYRIYRTAFEGFPFASYRVPLRANRWCLHDFAGDPVVEDDTEGLERTYLEAKRGAAGTGDDETASAFFIRELRYRRQRYADHARDSSYSSTHRFEATLRWLTNGFLDFVAGYGERPQRILGLALVVVVSSAFAYPAIGGLDTGSHIATYASDGPSAVLDGLYFSVVTFATLGLGDVHPTGDLARFLAASEALAGAFLTALFVFSLGRRVTR